MAGLPAPGIRQTGFYTIIFKRTVKEVGERGAEDFTLKTTLKKGVAAGKSSVEKLGEKGRESTEKIWRKYGEYYFGYSR